jgi:predicted dehydrogenase
MTSNRSFSRRTFLKTLGVAAVASPFVTRDLMANPPHKILRHASFGAAGMAGEDIREIAKFKQVELVAVAEVDLSRAAEVKKRYPSARVYQDWRQLLEREGKNLDSVNVSTPDHMHAPIGMTAMQMGLAIYGQKPLAHDLYEVRRMTEFARQQRLVTQMGIQIHSMSYYRLVGPLVQAGAIGKIKEVHSWCNKSWGDTSPRPDISDPVPDGFNWNLWLGVCGDRPFIGKAYYHPANWRKRLDFGTGTFGDMGCHIFDPVFDSLQLGMPISVRSEGPAPNEWNWALDSRIHYVFPGTPFTADKTIDITWYDGDQKPPKDVLALLEGDEMPGTGSILVGTQGAMLLPHVARPMLYPDKKFKDLQYPSIVSGDHWGEFVDACLTGSSTSAGFNYAGPLTEAVLLGSVACRFPQTTLKWNGPQLLFDSADANKFIRRQYRSGWQVKGLS